MTWIIISVLLSCHSMPDTPDTALLEKDLLHLETKIPLPGVHGRIDHLACDSAGHRLFVAALGNNSVEIVDLIAHIRVHSIIGLHEPQGVLYIPRSARLVVANGTTGTCVFYDSHHYNELGQVELGDDADNIRYDGSRIYVSYGSGGIAVIDPYTIKKIGDLPLGGHPESFQLGDSGRMYINVPDKGEWVQGDLSTLSIRNRRKNDGASANFPMALDEKEGRLFLAYRHPARLQIVNTQTGRVVASRACVGDADDLFFDRPSGLAFVSGGEGFLDVFRISAQGATLVNHIPTRKGARTCLWLPGERKLFLAVPARGDEDAAIWVYGM